MKVSVAFLLLLFLICATNADYWLPFPDECCDKCRMYFDKCADGCLNPDECPPQFPPFLDGCSEECQLVLEGCRDVYNCVDESVCQNAQ